MGERNSWHRSLDCIVCPQFHTRRNICSRDVHCPCCRVLPAYRPFGIQIDLTPIAAVDGEKEPDKVAESRGEAILRSGECEIRGGVVVSERLDSFTIQFDVPDDIRVELRDIPCAEQMYDPEKKILRADDVSVYRFSIVLLVYFEEYVAGQTYEYPLKIRDGNGGKPIQSIDLVTR
ncbi:hypothetical protein ACFQH8_16145 [Halomicroarcula sp. GCM10025710]